MSKSIVTQLKTSADNVSPVSFVIADGLTKHALTFTTTGTVAAGTAKVKVDGTEQSTSVDLTKAPVQMLLEWPAESIVVTPTSLSAACTFTVQVKSW